MLHLFRNSPLLRIFAIYVIASVLWQMVFPTAAYALTSGPTMPEYEQFAPPNLSNLVDPSSGGFSYAISLFNLEGQDVSLNYFGVNSAEEEATSFGWGWNFTPGTLMRQKRGLPDEFNGEDDKIKKELYIKPNRTYGLRVGLGAEAFGVDGGRFKLSIKANRGVFYNNYRGMGTEMSITPSLTAALKTSGKLTSTMGLGLGLGFNSQSGLGVDPNLSFDVKQTKYTHIGEFTATSVVKTYGMGISASYNSRAGLQQLGLNLSVERANQFHFKIDSKFSSGTPKIDSEGAAAGTLISYATPTYTPQTSFPFHNFSASLNAKMGPSAAVFPNMSFSGYFTEQSLSITEDEIPAYGYFHQEKAQDQGDGLLDFNREKDGVFINEASTHLALPFATYDLYTATGQAGIGMYHAQRSDRGILFDDSMRSTSVDGSFGAEFGTGTGFHLGLDASTNVTISRSGRWLDNNELTSKFSFKSKAEVGPDFEPFYFKRFGESPVEDDLEFLDSVGGTKPVRVKLEDEGKIIAKNRFEDKWGGTYSAQTYHRSKRAKRTQGMFMLTANETEAVGLEKEIRDYSFDGSTQALTYDPIPRIDAVRDPHDPSEFMVVNEGGTRSVYGLPVYNTLEKSVSFAAAGLVSDCEAGTIDYTPGTHNVNSHGKNNVGNQLGKDHYFSSEEIPPYAYSYLLTGILSADYVDLTGDGITDDDLGNAYQFHYKKLHDDYRWRTPYQENTASHMEGYRTKTHDDKASYSYGTKEIYQLIAITSENLRLELRYSDRNDGLGVIGENGGRDAGQVLQRVDRMELYNKKDREENGTAAELLKAANFEYNYELCRGVPNNHSTVPGKDGKLTLKKVWFSYGKSNRARFNPYEFTYADPDHDGSINSVFNPDYEEKSQDRWGNYKPNSCVNGAIPNWESPYTDQRVIPATDTDYYDPLYPDRRYADVYAQAWRLSSVRTPSGTQINIDYEADQIAYVEDKIAGQMVKVLGTGSSSDYSTFGNLLYEKTGLGQYKNHNFVFVELGHPVSSGEEFYRKYLKDIEYLYFNFDVDITGNENYERVPGYVEIENYGIYSNSIGWIEVKPKSMKDKEKNPFANAFAKESWDFARANMSEYIFPGSDPVGTGEDAIMSLLGFFMDLKTVFQGYNRAMRSKGFAQKFLPARSWLRLNCPDGKKRGGGIRVRQIAFQDNWNSMGGGITGVYGQQFEYTTKNEHGEEISSGVAAYEPLLGGDEIPHRQPHYFTKKKRFTLDDIYYLEEPFGESQFPGPSVKYSEVNVRSLAYEANGKQVTQNGMGYTKQLFYTAKDFPTLVDQTEIDPRYRTPNPILKFFKIGAKQHTTATQGYTITLNNMHGVPRGVQQFAEGGTEPISETLYEYRTTREGSKMRLDNEKVPVIYPNKTEGIATIGLEMDFSVDSREHTTNTYGFVLQGNLDVFLALFLPLPWVTFIPTPIYEQTRFRSMTTTKVIRRVGILDKITVRDGGATTTTHNLAYDSETGALLISKSTNEYRDELYSYNLPAHWAYDEGMGQAYKNTGMEWEDVSLDNIANADEYFVKGDELLLEEDLNPGLSVQKGWVLDIQGSQTISVIDENGELMGNGPYEHVKIIRSGRRNIPNANIGSVASKIDPRVAGLNSFDQVLGAGAVDYSDQWNTLCGPLSIDTACICTELTPAAQDLQSLLNALLVNSELDNSTVDLSSYPVFVGSSLESTLFPGGMGTGCTPTFVSIENAPTGICEGELTIDFGEDCSGFTSSCSITLEPEIDHPYCMSHFGEFINIRPLIEDSSLCVSSTKFLIDGVIPFTCNSEYNDTITFTGDMACFAIRSCEETISAGPLCGGEEMVLNPYVAGIRGNWAPKRAYTYLTHRGPTAPTAGTATDLRRDGVFQEFEAFWQYTNGAWSPTPAGWTWTAEATKRIPQGFDVESKDPLGRYSASLYGYNLRLPIAVAGNARYQEIANANFEVAEDYDLTCEAHLHLDGLSLVSGTAHTGLSSAELTNTEPLRIISMVSDTGCVPVADDVPYTLKDCDCAKAFSPTENGRYALSFWVQGEEYQSSPLAVYEYSSIEVEIRLNGTPLTVLEEQKSKLIEGWQRRELVFDLPAGTAGEAFEIWFSNTGASGYQMYLDDIRFHPFYGGMQAYVYDPLDLRLMATLDERGFATFYVYDEQNQLAGIKKETENGIISVSTQQGYVVPRAN